MTDSQAREASRLLASRSAIWSDGLVPLGGVTSLELAVWDRAGLAPNDTYPFPSYVDVLKGPPSLPSSTRRVRTRSLLLGMRVGVDVPGGGGPRSSGY